MTDLAYLSATEALRRFRARDLSPVELLDAVIARAEAVEPTINAFTWTRFDQARQEAAQAEACYMGRGDPPRPLEGVPIAIKDEMAVKGQPHTQGSLIYRDQVADHTDIAVARALDAGAVQHARTATPEFSIAGFTHSRLHGVTRNPWNPAFGAGGSSGGSAAALAAGSATLASGSDIGGSIRDPAACCGVVGFKASYGRVPVNPPANLDHYEHVGPLARTVADTALYYNTICGRDRRDVASLPALRIPEQLGDVSGLRVALTPDLGSWPLAPGIDENTRAVGEVLRSAGARVDEVDLYVDREACMTAAAVHYTAIWNAGMEAERARHEELLCDYTIDFLDDMARRSHGLGTADGLAIEAGIWEPIGTLFEEYDAIICATVAAPLAAGDGYVGKGIEIAGVTVEPYWAIDLALVFNIASRCPVLAVPSGFTPTGVPTGVMLTGRPYDDITPFHLGAAIEQRRPWLDAPERRPRL